MAETLEQLVGSKLVLGIPGTTITDDIISLFKETNADGLILFRRNLGTVPPSSGDSPCELIHDLEEALERRLIVMIDHEGGRVIHLPEGVTYFPDNLAAGFAGDEALVAKQGEIEAKELKRFGITLNLAPTLDVLTERHSPNIGIRSYGRDPGLVARLGAARIRAMQAGGLAACAKHFPGQGQSTIDAHLGLPRLEETLEEMKTCHLKPFVQAIQAGVAAIMSSHPLYPNWERNLRTPATFSRKIITDYLREELRFKGLILTDDMEMKSLVNNWPMEEAAVRASYAGHNLILCCSDSELQRKIFYGLLEAYRSKELCLRELERSDERIHIFKERFVLANTGQTPPSSLSFPRKRESRLDPPVKPEDDIKLKLETEGAEIAGEIAKKGLRILKQNPKLKLPLKEEPTLLLFPDLNELASKFAIEKTVLSEKCFSDTFLKERKKTAQIKFISLNPSEPEIKTVLEEKTRYAKIVYFCWDAHLAEGCNRLLDILQTEKDRLCVVLLRNPYDVDLIQEGVLTLTAFGFRSCQIQAVLDRLF